MTTAEPSPLDKKVYVHESSYIDENVQIHAGTKIWHFCHIMEGSKIGSMCSIGQNVVIGPRVQIGSNVKIQNNVSVYEGVTLEDDVFCGPSMVFTNVYNPRSKVVRKNEYRLTHVGRGVTLGANCTIVCGVRIGHNAFIGAGAVVNRNVKPYALVAGVPAKQIGWMSAHGEKLRLSLSAESETATDSTGTKYVLNGSTLKRTA